MNLPNYFLADLPPEAALTAGMVGQACDTLRANRDRYLARRPTAALVRTLADLARAWLQPDYSFRQLVLEQGPDRTGFSRETLAEGLDGFFESLTERRLLAWVEQEFAHPQRLDGFHAPETELEEGRLALARGPGLIAHIAAGNVPNPAWHSLISGLLVRSAQFMKCATGAAFLPRMFAHSLYEADPKLASCLELAVWPGGQTALETALWAHADVVTVTGSDAAVEDIRRRVPAQVRLLAHGERLNFGYVTAEALASPRALTRIARHAAADVAAWDQLGCLSPHMVFAEHGGACPPEAFAAELAAELARREETQPRGPLPLATSARIASQRAFYEIRAAASDQTRLWCSPGSTAWTVVYEADPLFQRSDGHRFIHVKGVANLTEALHGADTIRDAVSTVGLAAPDNAAPRLAQAFADWGANRVCPLGRMQRPPPGWRHDGRPALADLVTWTDWEWETL